MRVCPACGNSYPDDANFCPMDASKLPEPAAAAPHPVAVAVAAAVAAVPAPADTTLSDQPPPVGGRFLPGKNEIRTPVGTLVSATDSQAGGAVLLLVVDEKALPTPATADRMLRELKQLAKVKSEKLLRVIDQGKGADGRVYVASEAAPGPTLEEIVAKEGALSLERARAIVLAVGEALVEAQKVGVIHRDLAPRNVLVGDKIKLTGFGLAEPVTDKVFGAPAFLSPEQAEGKPVDQRSNIYSLGALLYYMVTGASPFSGDAAAQVQQHLHAQPTPPGQKRAGLPEALDRLVMKALEKSGGRRHLTLRQLLNEVESIAVATPVAEPGAKPDAALVTTPDTNVAAKGDVKSAVHPEKDDVTNARTVMGLSAPVLSAPPPEAPPAPAHTEPAETAPVAAPPEPWVAAVAPPPGMPDAPMNAATLIDVKAPFVGPMDPHHAQPDEKSDDLENARTIMNMTAPEVTPLPAPAPPPPEPLSSMESVPIPLDRPLGADKSEGAPTAPFAADNPTPVGKKSAAAKTVVTRTISAGATAPAAKGVGKKAAFRETGWFKKGEIEEEMAKKAAEMSKDDPLAGPSGEANVDESALTADDRARLSLKTGRTEMMPVIKMKDLPSDRMSEEEMLAEIDQSRKWLFVGGGSVLLVAVIAAVYFLFLR